MDETITEVREAEVPALVRAATVGSYRAEDNSVELVMTTGARRTAYDWWNGRYYEEELVVTKKSVNTERLDAGTVQLLDNHQTYGGVRSIFGVVTSYDIEDGKVTVRVKLSNDPAKAGIVGDIRDGVIRAVSFGYSQDAVEITQANARKDGGKMPLYRVTRFTPSEVSMVTVPADPHAGSRSDEAPQLPDNTPRSMQRCQFTFTRAAAPTIPKEPAMDEEQKRAAEEQAKRDAEAKAERERIAAEARDAEQKRSADITAKCASVGLAARAAEYIRDGLTIEQVNDKLIIALAERDAQGGGHRNVRGIQTVTDEHETRMQGILEQVVARVDSRNKVTDNGRKFGGMSLMEMGRSMLEGLGVNTQGMTRMELAGRILSTRAGTGMQTVSDFPSLMSNVANKRLRQAYDENPGSFRRWARRAPNLPDFKIVQVTQMSAMPDLELVNEHGEFKYGSVSDGQVTYSASTYGKILPFTRQSIINDDLRAFDRVVSGFGYSAARLENRLVYAQITSNPTMPDGVALFASGHGNLAGSGGAIAIGTLGAARTAMRLQKGLQNEELNITPTFLIVPATQEQLAYQYTSNNYVPNVQANINEFASGGRSALEVVVEPILDANSTTAWYLAASNGQIDTVEYAFLDGNEGVVIDTEVGFDVDGINIRARHDFATKVIESRGLYKNPGA